LISFDDLRGARRVAAIGVADRYLRGAEAMHRQMMAPHSLQQPQERYVGKRLSGPGTGKHKGVVAVASLLHVLQDGDCARRQRHAVLPGRHMAGLAWLLRCSKSSAAKQLAGQRRMQPLALERLAETLRRDGYELLAAAKDVAYIAQQLSAQPRRPHGFQLLSENGTDGRWRGGRPKGAKDRHPRRRRDGGSRPDRGRRD
jgi:hypothetical protein